MSFQRYYIHNFYIVNVISDINPKIKVDKMRFESGLYFKRCTFKIGYLVLYYLMHSTTLLIIPTLPVHFQDSV